MGAALPTRSELNCNSELGAQLRAPAHVRTADTIKFHFMVRKFRIMLPITVIRRSFARSRDSIYISSYICIPVSSSGTLNPTVNVDDSLLLPATLTLPKMSGLILPSCSAASSGSAGGGWGSLRFLSPLFRRRPLCCSV